MFLNQIIYPKVIDDSIVHDTFNVCNDGGVPIPDERVGQEFVGEVFDENDNPNLEHRSFIV